jgi:hypothetical protein
VVPLTPHERRELARIEWGLAADRDAVPVTATRDRWRSARAWWQSGAAPAVVLLVWAIGTLLCCALLFGPTAPAFAAGAIGVGAVLVGILRIGVPRPPERRRPWID